MKYSININQVALADTGLDFNDGAILDYLCVLAMSVNANIARHRVYRKEPDEQQHQAYTWVDYATMLAELPMLPFKSRSRLSERVAKIAETGYIKTYRDSSSRLYFCLTEKADELFSKKEPSNNSEARSEYRKALEKPVRNIERPVRNIERGRSEYRNNSNTNDSNTNIKDSTSDDVMQVYLHFCKIFKKNKDRYALSSGRARKIELRLKDAGKAMLLEAITRCERDDFYSGRSKKWHGADLDWIVGKYENVEKLANLIPNSKLRAAPTPQLMKMPERRKLTPEQQERANEKIAEIRQKLNKKFAVK